MKKQLLILMTLFISVIGYSQAVGDTFVEDSQFFSITSLNPNEVQVFNYITSASPVVNIPSTVINAGNTYSVTRIHVNAFANKGLTDVTIPNSVVTIGSGAFFGNQLTSIIIPDSISDIDFAVFNSNPLTCIISEATTPPIVVTGASDSFGNRSNINLTIPTGTASAYTAATWTGFNSVAEGLTGNFVVNNITYQVTSATNNTVRTSDYNIAGGTIVNIPATVTRTCTTYNVTEIGPGSFFNKQLTSVGIPSNVTSIGSTAFANNFNLASVPLHNGITSIGTNAFNTCALTSVNIPNNLTVISQQAFQGNQITNLVIPNGVTHVEEGAFAANLLTSIDMADSVIFLGEAVFLGNNIADLSDVVLSIGLTSLPQQFLANNQLTSLTIPNSITSIGERAFQSNSLTSITIHSGVTFINDRAFDNNPLADVYSEALTPPIIITGNLDTFGDRSNTHLHIPAGTMGAYVTNTGALWTGFNPVTEDALSTPEFALANDIKVITTIDGLEVISNNSVRLENYTIYSITGAKVKDGTESTITTNALSNGIYVLKLDFDKGTLVKKFAK